jgi:hypothetical protein
MFGRNRTLFLSATLAAALAACTQAKPASTLPTQSAEVEQTTPAADPSSRALLGAAPTAPAHRFTAKPAAAPIAQPLPAETAMDPDDPMRQFDLP